MPRPGDPARPQPRPGHRWRANEGPGRITIAALEAKDLQVVVDVVLHETIHLLEKVGFLGMYRRISQFYGLEDIEGEGYWNAHLLVHEALVEALVPGGVLAPILGGDIRDFMTESARQRAVRMFNERQGEFAIGRSG